MFSPTRLPTHTISSFLRVLLFSLVVGIALFATASVDFPEQGTAPPVAAQEGTPNGGMPTGVFPTGNELPACEYTCRIYAAVPGPPYQLGVVGGIYEIDVCSAFAMKLIAPLAVAWEIAADGGNALRVDNGFGFYRFDLTTGVFTYHPSTTALSNSLTELDDFWYAGDQLAPAPNLYRVTTGGGSLPLGMGPPFLGPYSGDLAYWPDTPLFGSVSPVPGASVFATVSRRTGAQIAVPGGGLMGGNIYGLAYNGTGTLWASDAAGDIGPVNPATGAWTYATTLPFIPYDLASTPRCGELDLTGDLGDAPDSTNHTVATMSAYTGTQARFPTVYDPATGAQQGPIHWLPQWDVWLGDSVSKEKDADLLPDEDQVTNLLPLLDTPDSDLHDDGLVAPLTLPPCQLTQFQFDVTVTGDVQQRYVNAWLDFNRDGDWEDQLYCVDPVTLQAVSVSEWAVQNHGFTVGQGTHTLNTPQFRSLDPNDTLWMRLSVAESMNPYSDGSGPNFGFEFGETEDYLLVPDGQHGAHGYSW